MKAIVYSRPGDSDVLQLVDRPVPGPGPGEVRVRVQVSGVNPTDWKQRRGGPPAFATVVPNQDGAGTVDAVGPGVLDDRVGERVWLWEAARAAPRTTARCCPRGRRYRCPTAPPSTSARAWASPR